MSKMGSYDCCVKQRCMAADFRTSTGVGHRHIYPQSELYEHIGGPLDKVFNETVMRETYITSNHCHDYKGGPKAAAIRALEAAGVNYTRTVHEKGVMQAGKPLGEGATGVSECQANYLLPRKIPKTINAKFVPITPAFKCKVETLGLSEQPPIPVQEPGVMKLLDPYVSTAMMSYVPYSRHQQMGVAKKDIHTIYDILELPKCKGFGPKKLGFVGPLLSIRKQPIYDSAKFKLARFRAVPTRIPHVPHVGLKSETQARFGPPMDDFSSRIWDNGVEYNQPYPRPSPWETLSVPNMYCTEYCHIGSTGFPVQAVVDPGVRSPDWNPELLECKTSPWAPIPAVKCGSCDRGRKGK